MEKNSENYTCTSSCKSSLWFIDNTVFTRLSSSLRSVMKERMVVQRNIIDIEAAKNDVQVKLYRKVNNCFFPFVMILESNA